MTITNYIKFEHPSGRTTTNNYRVLCPTGEGASSPNGEEHDVQSQMLRPTITDMQDKYGGDCYDIYLVQSQYKGNHKRGGVAFGRATSLVVAAEGSSHHNTCFACRCDWTPCSSPLGLHVPWQFGQCADGFEGPPSPPMVSYQFWDLGWMVYFIQCPSLKFMFPKQHHSMRCIRVLKT